MMALQCRKDFFDGAGKGLAEHATKERAQANTRPVSGVEGRSPDIWCQEVGMDTGAASITGTCVACSTISEPRDFRAFQRYFCYTICYVVAGFANPCSSFGGRHA